MHGADESKFSGESRIVTSLPVVNRRQMGLQANSSEGFFKLDEELNQDYLPKTRYTDPIQEDFGDDVDLSNLDFDSDPDENVEFRPRGFTVGSPITPAPTTDLRGLSIQRSSPKPNVAASIPIDISSSYRSVNVDGEEEVISINNLEAKLNKEGANQEEIAEAFSLREQTLFRNMQLMSLSVQPDDCPERLFGMGTPHDPAPHRIGASTYAPGGIHIPQQAHGLQNSPASVQMPRQAPRVVRPSSQQQTMHVKGDRLPTQHRM